MTKAWQEDSFKLFLLGFLTLFLELTLIRFLPGNIWNLGYFPNFVLIAVFMGMAVGFIGHPWIPERRTVASFVGAGVLLLALCAFVSLAHPAVPGFSKGAGVVGGELFFTSTPDSGIGNSILSFLLCFLGVMFVFALISQYTAKFFLRLPPLKAYTLDILGSCCGILSFMAISWLCLPAFVWFLLSLPVFILIVGPRRWTAQACILISLGLCAYLAWNGDQQLLSDPEAQFPVHARWSPYQKIEHVESNRGWHYLFANGIGHQAMLPPKDLDSAFYQVPYQHRKQRPELPPYKSVLILGAGSGNDVQAALQNGASHVDAVEIDPVIAEFGKEYHPLHPYSDSRVDLIIDDGRAFMNRTQRRYDLVVFALTDSLVKVSPMTQLRLENYLFTEESVHKAFELLNENGSLVFYNYYRKQWLFEKLQHLIERATGKTPSIPYENPDLKMLLLQKSESSPPVFLPTLDEGSVPTDDWPFLYLQRRAIPNLYLFAMLAMTGFVAIVAWLLRWTHKRFHEEMQERAPARLKLAFLCMGVAFLLLETKSVIQFSLLFGTTWLNSSLVFLAILLLVLAANRLAAKLPQNIPLWWLYLPLLISSLIPLIFPLGNLLGLESSLWRFVLASLLTFSPIFFANILFSLVFRNQKLPEQLFGWNLLGASLGGVVEYSSMALGYSALAVLVGLLYTGAFLLLRRTGSLGK